MQLRFTQRKPSGVSDERDLYNLLSKGKIDQLPPQTFVSRWIRVLRVPATN